MLTTPLRACGPIKNINVLAMGCNNIGQIITSLGVRNKSSKDSGDKCCSDVAQTDGRKVEPWPKPEEPAPTCWRTECFGREPQPPNYDPYRIKVPEVAVPPLPPGNAKAAIECAKIKSQCSPAKAPDPLPCPPPPRPPFDWTYIMATTAFLAVMGMLYKLYLMKLERDKNNDAKPIWRPRRKVKRPYHDKDLPPCVQYLIVGTGAAGWAAYQAIKNLDPVAKVFFITKEDILPYIRPPMSKYMWWNKDPPDIMKLNFLVDGRRFSLFLSQCKNFMDPVKFYRRPTGPAVSIASGWCVIRVDPDEHRVWVRTMCGEQPIYYERAVLAVGSKAKNLNVFNTAPKAVRDKMTTFRTIRDLEIAFRRVREAKHVVILGGGILGTELAWHLGKMNEVVEREEDQPPIQFVHMYKDRGILAGIIPSYLGEWAAERVKCESVQMMPNTQIYDAYLTKDKRLLLTLSNGTELVTDYVIVAVGTTARTELAEPSHLEVDTINGGFAVNTELEARTHLYVAGDAASVYSQWKNTRIRMEHYDNAEEQGYIAGANMTGYWTPSNMEPHYWLRLGKDLQMEVVGEVGACMPTIGLFKPCESEEANTPVPPPYDLHEVVAVAGVDPAKPCYKKTPEYKNMYKRGILFYLRDDVVVGVAFWNLPPIDDRKMVATEILRARASYKDINLLAELLGFHHTECVYMPPEALLPPGPCIKNYKTW